MNIKEIDKWLDNEYGVSYTRLEELHDFVVEQDLKHREETDKLNEDLEYSNHCEEQMRKTITNLEYKIATLEEQLKEAKKCLGIISPSRELKEGKYWENEEIERLNKRIEDLNIINEEHQALNGMTRNQLQQKENIIKEVREYIEKEKAKLPLGRNDFTCEMVYSDEVVLAKELLEILDKGE